MNKEAKTYQTPHGAILGEPEQPGALWYGVVRRREWHAVAVIKEEGEEVLCSGPTFYGWVPIGAIVRDAE